MKKFFERFCYITRKNTIINLEEDIKTLVSVNDKMLETIKEKDDTILTLIKQIDDLKLIIEQHKEVKEEIKEEIKKPKVSKPKKDKKSVK